MEWSVLLLSSSYSLNWEAPWFQRICSVWTKSKQLSTESESHEQNPYMCINTGDAKAM